MDGISRPVALLSIFALCASIFTTAPEPVFADSGALIQRIKGTVGFSSSDGARNDVVTSAGLPAHSEAYSGCSSLASVSLNDGARVMLGGATSFMVPVDGGPAMLRWGALRYDAPETLATPLLVKTKFGTTEIARGSGYIVAGNGGVQTVVISGGSNDVHFLSGSTSTAIGQGRSLTANALVTGEPVANADVNNSALYQFNDGRNPLGTNGTASEYDPTSSPTADCKYGAAAAGTGLGALAALAGLGAAAAIAVGASGGGSTARPTSGPTNSPGPTPTPTPGAGGTPTPTPIGGTPTPTPIGGTPTPTPIGGTPTPTPIGGTPTPTPIGGTPTPTPIGGTPTPTAVPLGPVILNPGAIIMSPAIGAPASASFTASQVGFTGAFTISQPTCAVGLLGTPTSSISGDVITVNLPSQIAALDLDCTVTVTGGGGQTAVEPIVVDVSIAGATPTPTPAGGLGPVVLNPDAIVLSPGIGSAASATFTASQTGYTGAFTVSQPNCPVGLLGTPTSSIVGNSITVTLPSQIAAVDLLCTVTVTGGGGASAVEPITVDISVLGPTPTPTPSGGFGPLVLNPSAIVLSPGVGSAAAATITATQTGYAGPFTVSQPVCAAGLLGAPTSSIVGNTITVSLPSQIAAVDLGCTVTVTGGGGATAVEPITIDVSVLGATPTPTPSGGLGPVVANPSSITLAAAIGAPATQTITVSQTGYTGTFSATEASCLTLGTPPGIAIAGDIVTVTLPAQTLALSLGCSITITGGGGQTATVPVIISVTALGTPAPTAAPTGGVLPLTTSPTSVLLNPSGISPATTNVIVSPSSEGPFTATTSCLIALGAPPVTTVTGNVVTISVPAQVIAASVGCDTIITSQTTGQSVTVPVTVGATVIGPASPSPSPNPTGVGPLYAVPASILLNPGVTTDASSNIEIYDQGFIGTYAVSLAPGCLALQQPVVKLEQGNVVNITVPGQLLNVALLCSITISDGTQTIAVPVTISASVLGSLLAKKPLPLLGTFAFSPPVATLGHEGDSQSIAMIGGLGPFRTTTSCPTGSTIDASVVNDLTIVRATSIGSVATCMVSVYGAGATFGQIPVQLEPGVTNRRLEPIVPGAGPITLSSSTIVLHPGELRSILISATGSVAIDGSCGRVADTALDGHTLHVTARNAGACTVFLRTASGANVPLSIVVPSAAVNLRKAAP
jgi:hypothetical protein